MKPRFRTLASLSIVSICFATAPAVHAQTWGGATTAWSLATNWTPAAVPANDANIFVAATTNNGMSLDGGISRSIGSLTFGPTGTRAGQFTVNSLDQTLTMKGGVVANGAFVSGTAALTFRGNFIIPTAQTWSIGGVTGPEGDHGMMVRE
ncbi:MAG: hypothetical protein EOP85_18090, partial [Verrucomicrobiaceae bacterium]